jgi:ankyrin repeat protein
MPLCSQTFAKVLAPVLGRVGRQVYSISQLILFCAFLGLSMWSRPGCAADIRQEDLDFSLIQAAGRGDVASFNLALTLGANVAATDRQGTNAVLMATQGEQHRLLRMLLDQGGDPNVCGASGFTPLAFAAMRGLDGDLRLLLKAGADPNKQTALGDTPLQLAVEFSRNELIGELVAAGVRLDDVNAAGETALIVAIRVDNRPGFDALLAQGATASVHDKTGRSALFWAILENHEAMAVALIEHGATFDARSDGYTPLRMARIMQHASVVAALTQRGATD